MTFRSVIIGLGLGLGIAMCGYFSDWIMNQAFLTTNLVPLIAFGLLLMGLLLLNPLLRLLGGSQLKRPEWAVIIGLMLVACVIPGPGMMWHFSNNVVAPHKAYNALTGWRKHELIRYLPDSLLVDQGPIEKGMGANPENYDDVIGNFGAGQRSDKPLYETVPWHAWTKTLSFYIPFIALSFIGAICVMAMFHQQWSHRERLRYPIAYFTSELISGAEGGRQSIWRNKLFWIGFVIPLTILLLNGLHEYAGGIKIPLLIDLRPISRKWPVFAKVPDFFRLVRPTLYFSVAAFAYFVSSEISFSLGINSIVYAIVFLALSQAGFDTSGDSIVGSNHSYQMFGSCLGLALVILYTGRKFYSSALAKAFFIPVKEKVEPSVVWFCWGAMLAALGMVLMMTYALGLSWILAVLFVLLLGMSFTVLTRINVETGLFMIQPGWSIAAIMLAIFGFASMGPHSLIIIAMLTLALAADPMVCLMPMAANALKIGETENIKPSRFSRWLVVAVLIALVGGMLATICVQYRYGGDGYDWADDVPQKAFQLLQTNLIGSDASPAEPQALNLSMFTTKGPFLVSAGVGLAIVLFLSMMRLRHHWWPIHPVLFLIWGTFPGNELAASFLVGWLCKVGITTFGGGQSYSKNKPLFVGIIAGEFAAGMVWLIVGAIYFMYFKVAPPEIRFLPK